MGAPHGSLEDRFWRHVSPEPNTGCWLWSGSLQGKGYGRINDGTGRVVLAHRLAYELYNGPIPEGKGVLHKRHCKHRCVNPEHLYAGTQAENGQDAVATGALSPEMHPLGKIRKLTRDDAARIRSRYAAGGVSQHSLAKEFGVCQYNISKIVRGIAWR